MSEKPILFKTEMVQAILAGRKSQTRRLSNRFQVGDILWVKETWAKPSVKPCYLKYLYKANFSSEDAKDTKWKPSIFMPKKVARLWLEVTAVREEKLQNISYEDILAEGWDARSSKPMTDRTAGEDAYDWWIDLWKNINKKEGTRWADNPIVYVNTFEVKDMRNYVNKTLKKCERARR